MNEVQKYRLAGAAVITALITLILPIYLSKSPNIFNENSSMRYHIPLKPQKPRLNFSSIPQFQSVQASNEPSNETQMTTENKEMLTLPDSKANKSQTPVQPTHVKLAGKLAEATLAEIKPDVIKGHSQVTLAKAWIVQIGTFRSKQNADALVKKLRLNNFLAYNDPFIRTTGKSLFRVMVGPYLTEKKARMTAKKIDKAVHLRTLVKRFHPVNAPD